VRYQLLQPGNCAVVQFDANQPLLSCLVLGGTQCFHHFFSDLLVDTEEDQLQ